MSTIIYPAPIFGPVHSRRLGVSLGINLLPGDGKFCTFDCIYCECGYNKDFRPKQKVQTREAVREALEKRLAEMKENGPFPDVLTFAGNGEPTANPYFPEIIEDTLALRDKYFPNAKVSVLSNATLIHNPKVFAALNKVDNNILKLDSAIDSTMRIINQPHGNRSVAETVELMKRFNGHLIIQTMFLRGRYNGQTIDNTTEKEVSAWLDLIREIAPKQVMIYTIDRETPAHELIKIPVNELSQIGERVRALGIPCSVSGATEHPSTPDSTPNPEE